MKKQINPNIKAHLIRSAFYVTLLLAVCVIPFALAQRNTRQSAAAGKMSRMVPPSTGTLKVKPGKPSNVGVFAPASAFRLSLPKAVSGHFGEHTRVARNASVDTPLFTYSIDDGTAEDSIGLTAGGNFLALNSFPVTGGNNLITSISIAWGTPAFPDPSLDGLPYTAVLWSDPNGDGSPTDAVVLATADGVISQAGTDTFLTSDIPPTLVTTSNFFVGFVITHAAGQFPGAFDESAPISNRSWVSIGGNINDLSDAVTIESQGLSGNWLIRAEGGLPGLAVTSTDPAVDSVVFTQPTDFVVNVNEAVDPSTVQPSDFTVNGTPANTDALSNGNQTITFTFTTSPVVDQGEQTMHIADGAFLSDPDGDPVHEFNGTFRYDATLLEVTDTVPPVGGTFSPPAPGTYQYDVNFNEEVDPASVDMSDLQLSGNAGGTVTGVTVLPGNTTVEFTLNISFGGNLTADIAAGAITDQFGNPGAAFNGSYTVEGCPPSQYVITEGTDAIVPGTTDTGNHEDDGDTLVPLPFTFQLYDQTYNAVSVSSNGRLDFVVQNEPGGYVSACLPAPPNIGPYDFTVFGLWQDLMTLTTNPGCSTWANGCGIFTTVEGTQPNRIFDIEWHAVLFFDTTQAVNFEVRLFEGDPNLKFEIVYGAVSPAGTSHPYVGGVQGNSGAGFFTQDFCGATPPQNVSRNYEIPPCGSTPTPTPSVTPTPTVTPTPPPHRPTPRPRPTPYPRPTP